MPTSVDDGVSEFAELTIIATADPLERKGSSDDLPIRYMSLWWWIDVVFSRVISLLVRVGQTVAPDIRDAYRSVRDWWENR